MSPRLLLGLALSFLLLSPAANAEGLLVSSGQSIAFLGDSITQQGWDNPGGYVQLVTDGFATLGVKIVPIPAGISGHTSKDMLARIQKDVIDKKPDWMTLSCGVNDVMHGADGVVLEQYKTNITSIVDQVQAAGIKIVVMTATPIGEELSNVNNGKLVPYNAFLKQLAQERHLPVADENTAFQAAITAGAKPGVKVLTGDGVHPISEGHQVMAKAILAAFGATPAQLDQVEQAWLDTPSTAKLATALTFQAGGVTLRQYRALKAYVVEHHTGMNELTSKLLYDCLIETAKAHASDPVPLTQSQMEIETQKALQAKIDSLGKS